MSRMDAQFTPAELEKGTTVLKESGVTYKLQSLAGLASTTVTATLTLSTDYLQISHDRCA